jgi:hypothetical protein
MTDSRIPVFTGDPAGATGADAVLHDIAWPAPAHAVGCACCAPRPALARALSALFLARARGETAWFERVVVACASSEDTRVAAAIAADPVSQARFRFVGRLPAQAGSEASPSPSARCM